MENMENVYNHIEEANRQILNTIGEEYMKAEKARWVAQMSWNSKEAELQGEIAAKWEALARLLSPPSHYFCGYNKLPDCTGVQYRYKLLEAALAADPSNYILEDNVAALRLEVQQEMHAK